MRPKIFGDVIKIFVPGDGRAAVVLAAPLQVVVSPLQGQPAVGRQNLVPLILRANNHADTVNKVGYMSQMLYAGQSAREDVP